MKSLLYIFFFILCTCTYPLLGQDLSKKEEKCKKIGISKIKKKKKKTKFKFKISLYKKKEEEEEIKMNPKFR